MERASESSLLWMGTQPKSLRPSLHNGTFFVSVQYINGDLNSAQISYGDYPCNHSSPRTRQDGFFVVSERIY